MNTVSNSAPQRRARKRGMRMSGDDTARRAEEPCLTAQTVMGFAFREESAA
jgi:hypothetical protein